MKQVITREQLESLSVEGKARLLTWFEKYADKKFYPLFSIGQMMQFLDEDGLHISTIENEGKRFWYVESPRIEAQKISFVSDDNLCDALWGACELLLEHEK